MKRSTSIAIISAVLLLLYLYAALSKLVDHERFQQALQMSPLFEKRSEFVAWALPVSEIIVALLLFIPRWRLKGLYASFILLAVFTFYLVYVVSFASHLPCTCGGIIQKLSWAQHIFFNIFFMILSLIAICLYIKFPVKLRMTPP